MTGAAPAPRALISARAGGGEAHRATGLTVQAGGRDPCLCQSAFVAAWYCSTTRAGMRPRSLTARPACSAHARMLSLRSRLDAVRSGRRPCPRRSLARMPDEGRELPAERGGVLLAQIDLYGRRLEPDQGHGYPESGVMRAEELAATQLASLVFRRGRNGGDNTGGRFVQVACGRRSARARSPGLTLGTGQLTAPPCAWAAGWGGGPAAPCSPAGNRW